MRNVGNGYRRWQQVLDTKAEMKRFAAEKFERDDLRRVNREQYLRAAAKAGRDAEAAFVEE